MTTSTPRIHALTLPLWRLGSTLWCDVIADRRNCLWNWFLVVCLPAGPVAYAWFARWVYCLISLMMVASWLKEQCFAGISSCICSPNGWFCFSRKRHLAAICDANRYGKLPRLVGQVSERSPGPGEVCILCEILYVSIIRSSIISHITFEMCQFVLIIYFRDYHYDFDLDIVVIWSWYGVFRLTYTTYQNLCPTDHFFGRLLMSQDISPTWIVLLESIYQII